MTRSEMASFRVRLQELAERTRPTAASVEKQARQTADGETVAGLLNGPMHTSDFGGVELDQELGAALLENERYLVSEIEAALDRIEAGTYGRCERCGRKIPRGRLRAIPYARHCVVCAAILHDG